MIADILRGQWKEPVKKLTRDNYKKMVPLSNMMYYFQPLDLTVNHCYKAFLRNKAQTWYLEQVQKQIINRWRYPRQSFCWFAYYHTKASPSKMVDLISQSHVSKRKSTLNGWKKSGITQTMRKNNERKTLLSYKL